MKTIRARVVIAMTLAGVLVVASAVVLWLLVDRMTAAASALYNESLQGVDFLIQSDRDSYQSNLALADLIAARERGRPASETKDFVPDISDNRDQVTERFGYFVDAFGEARLDPALLDQFHSNYARWSALTDEIVADAQSDTGLVSARNLYSGGAYGAVYDPMRDALDQLTQIVEDAAQRQLERVKGDETLARYAEFSLFGVFAIAFALVLVLMLRTVLRPVVATSEIVRDIAEGEGDLSRRLDERRNDEIGTLVRYFNLFLEKLSEIVRRIVGTTEQARLVKDTLVSMATQAQAAVTEIAANLDNMRQRSTALDSGIDRVGESITTLGSALGELERQIVDQAAMVEESSAAVNEMIASINNVAEIAQKRQLAADEVRTALEEGNETLSAMAATVATVDGSVDSILEITQVISSIAAQTNLLAMNAAIEAAHAGDSGRGFAVVADEIRKLAETSSVQSTEINRVLQSMTTDVRNAASESVKTQTSFDRVDREFTDLGQALAEISATMAELRNGSQQITEAMTSLQTSALEVREQSQRMRAERESIQGEIATVRAASSELVGGMNEVTIGTGEITTAVNGLNEQSNSVSDVIVAIQNEVGQFTISDRDAT